MVRTVEVVGSTDTTTTKSSAHTITTCSRIGDDDDDNNDGGDWENDEQQNRWAGIQGVCLLLPNLKNKRRHKQPLPVSKKMFGLLSNPKNHHNSLCFEVRKDYAQDNHFVKTNQSAIDWTGTDERSTATTKSWT